MQFSLCENTGFYLRVALVGPPGSGKTFTALRLATEMGYQKVGIIDTENRSARRYARSFSQRFVSLELESFSPRDYIGAIQAAVKAGVEVLVIDSLSHAWMGKGGVLEMVDQAARRQSRNGAANSFTGWREVTPEHNRLVEELIRAPLHLIVTMRVKTDYIVEKDAQGKSVPRKVGLAPIQRDGLEYEFDIVGDVSPEHELCITKTRYSPLAGAVIPKPGAELARDLRAWVDGAEVAPPPPTMQEPSEEEIRGYEVALAEADSIARLDHLGEEIKAQLPGRTAAQDARLRKAYRLRRAALEKAPAAPAEAPCAS